MVESVSQKIQQMCTAIHRQTMRGGPSVGFVSKEAYEQLLKEPGTTEIARDLLCWRNRVYLHLHKDWNKRGLGLDVRLVWPGNRLRFEYITPEDQSDPEPHPDGTQRLNIPEVHIKLVPDIEPDVVEEHEFTDDEWEAILND